MEILTNLWLGLMSFLTGFVVPLGWQLTLLIIALLFWTPIAEAITRLRSAGKDGVVLDASKQGGKGTSTPNLRNSGELKEPNSPLNHQIDPSLKPFFDNVLNHLEEEKYANEKEALADALVTAQRASYSQQILRSIFGSQISFLYDLKDRGQSDSHMVQSHFEIHKNKASDGAFSTPEEWYRFLLTSGLIIGEPPNFLISDSGRAAVSYFRLSSVSPQYFLY